MDSKMAVIKKAPLDQQAAAALRASVLSGEFPPGYRLVETWLADQLQLSRGTVRAALSQLTHEGLVEQVAYTRWVVPSLSARDAWELYTLRSSLEGLAARLLAQKMNESLAGRLQGAMNLIREAAHMNDRGSLTERDAALHSLIIELSDHRRLQRQYTIIEQQIRRYIACSNALAIEPSEIVSQHEPIVTTLIAGDAEGAEREAKRHNYVEGEILVGALRQKEALQPEPHVAWPKQEGFE